jgi:hypothetical protein
MTQRTGIVAGGNAVEGHAQGTGHTRSRVANPDAVNAYQQHEQLRYLSLLKNAAFDYTHPVDEYGPNGSANSVVITNQVNVQPDYDMPERIEHLAYVLPLGTTTALIVLGSRAIQVYNGPALTTIIASTLFVGGIILGSDDLRQLNLTGTLTSAPYLGLTGFALTRGQFS